MISFSKQGGSCLAKSKGKSLSYCCHTTLMHISFPGLQKPEVLVNVPFYPQRGSFCPLHPTNYLLAIL